MKKLAMATFCWLIPPELVNLKPLLALSFVNMQKLCSHREKMFNSIHVLFANYHIHIYQKYKETIVREVYELSANVDLNK